MSGPSLEPIQQRMARVSDLVTVALDQLLPRSDGPESRLTEAMRHAALGPGPRIQAFFAIEAGRMLEADERPLLRAVCALECVHAYAQAHRGLPELADQEVHRGRPALRRTYDEATAVLAGDALQSAAFEIMAHIDTHPDPSLRNALVRKLALAAGAKGLAGGQMLDQLGLGSDVRTVARMQRMKTGALISLALEIPLILAAAQEPERHALMAFGQDLSVAYELVDELRSGEIRSVANGRPTRAANDAEDQTQASSGDETGTGGAESGRQRLQLLRAQCHAHLEIFGSSAGYLRAGVDSMLSEPT